MQRKYKHNHMHKWHKDLRGKSPWGMRREKPWSPTIPRKVPLWATWVQSLLYTSSDLKNTSTLCPPESTTTRGKITTKHIYHSFLPFGNQLTALKPEIQTWHTSMYMYTQYVQPKWTQADNWWLQVHKSVVPSSEIRVSNHKELLVKFLMSLVATYLSVLKSCLKSQMRSWFWMSFWLSLWNKQLQ
jgi:hypothetical protein